MVTKAVLVYELGHIPELLKLQEEGPLTVLSLDAEVDSALREKKIEFLSAKKYRSRAVELYTFPEQFLSCMETWEWFSYRGVSFSKVIFPTLQGYVQYIMYWGDIVANFLRENPTDELIILPPLQRVPEFGAAIAAREIAVIETAASLAAEQHTVKVRTYPAIPVQRSRGRFSLSRIPVEAGVVLLNILTRMRPRKKIRILASDYWRNIASVLAGLPEAEVTLCERKEALNAGVKNIWKYRMHFAQPRSFRGAVDQHAAAVLQTTWEKHRTIPEASYANIALTGFIQELLDEVFTEWVPLLIEETNRIYAMIESVQPHVVLLRATVSQQWHFPLLALIAREKGIPSFELLHGMEYPGPGSVDKRHVAEYVGVYGTYVQNQLIRAGFAKDFLPIIGSPRFDAYQLRGRAPHPHDGVVVFCTAPDIYVGATFDTYDIEEYFSTVAEAVKKLPHASALIKLRPGRHRESFYRGAIEKAFAGVSHEIAQFERLQDLFAKCDIAVSCQTTVTLEALQCGVPLVLFASTPVEEMILSYNFKAAKDAVRLCTHTELPDVLQALTSPAAREQQVARADAFLEQGFSFDGKSGERAATFIRSVTL